MSTDVLFQPTRVGPLSLRNRIMLPPHAAVLGDMWGPEDIANISITYWKSRAEDGAAWIDGITGFIENSNLPPGFVPTGVGARTGGIFRLPIFRERAGQYADAVHKAGAVATTQLVLQAGKPHSPSGILPNYTDNYIPHSMTVSEIKWLIDEYVFAGKESQAAGLDGVELHANHEDLLQSFLSPATNHRDDEYGGDFDRRLKLVEEIVRGIRAETGPDFAIGVRFNMDEFYENGYDLDEGIRIIRALNERAGIDYLHGVIGNNWGAPSYLQTHRYGLAEWADFAKRYRDALDIPVVYTGRVTTMDAAADVITNGQADVVGIARANFADGNLITKTRTGRLADIRPCIGCNDCLHGPIVEALPFGCSINPRAGQEHAPMPAATTRKEILVVGGGPAGMELAVLSAERGHKVTLWEKAERLGGQMNIAAQVPENEAYSRFVDHQTERLNTLGVEVVTGMTADSDAIRAAGVDHVAIATGGTARGAGVTGEHLPFVQSGWDVLSGHAIAGKRVVVIAREDHMQPLTIASYLARAGSEVTLIYQTHGIAPLVGKYTVGSVLGQLSAMGVKFRVMERVTSIEQGRIDVKNIYSGAPESITDFDSVVTACGANPVDGLYRELDGTIDNLHILGDAYAPRRILFATRQAWHLAGLI